MSKHLYFQFSWWNFFSSWGGWRFPFLFKGHQQLFFCTGLEATSLVWVKVLSSVKGNSRSGSKNCTKCLERGSHHVKKRSWALTSQQPGRQQQPGECKCQIMAESGGGIQSLLKTSHQEASRAGGATWDRRSHIWWTVLEWGGAGGTAMKQLQKQRMALPPRWLIPVTGFVLWNLILGGHGLPRLFAKPEFCFSKAVKGMTVWTKSSP